MAVKNNQIEVPFTPEDAAKLDGITPGAQPQPAIATQAEAEAGTDNMKMMTPIRTAQAIVAQGGGGGGSSTGQNLGGGAGVFAQKFGSALQFKTLVAGTGVTITPQTQTIVISAATSADTNSYLNNSGVTLGSFTLVRQDSAGNMNSINPSIEAEVINVLGVLLQATTNGNYGPVALGGLITNITTSFALQDILYLGKSGAIVNTVPDIGANGFLAGDFVIKVGRITKNLDVPANKDFKMELEILGQL